jgi:hypothetical protein
MHFNIYLVLNPTSTLNRSEFFFVKQSSKKSARAGFWHIWADPALAGPIRPQRVGVAVKPPDRRGLLVIGREGRSGK